MSELATRVTKLAPSCADLVVYCDGEYVAGRDAAVSVWDHGLLYGDGVFEGIRLYTGAFFRFDDHLRRLKDGLTSVGIADPFTGDDALRICSELVRRNELDDAHLRLMVTRGVGSPGLNPRNCAEPTVLGMAYTMPPTLGAEPITLITSSIRRMGPGFLDPKIKSLNYLPSVVAKHIANHYGADDALMLDPEGCVAEGTGANVFAVKDGVLRTPHTTSALEGVTRRTILELAHHAGIPTSLARLSCHDLYTADEVFLCGSAAEIVPVRSIDGRLVGDASSERMTSTLHAMYLDCVHNDARYRTSVH